MKKMILWGSLAIVGMCNASEAGASASAGAGDSPEYILSAPKENQAALQAAHAKLMELINTTAAPKFRE